MRPIAIVAVTAALAFGSCGAASAAPEQSRVFGVYFTSGSATLTPEAQQVIHAVADAAQRHERSDLVIDGIAHRDNGSALASRRAAAVASALRRAGVAETMVSLRTGLDADGSRFAGDGAPAGQVARSAD